MGETYYVVELTLKWLILLLVGLALLIVLAFAGGYGAAWSVLSAENEGVSTVKSEPKDVLETEEIKDEKENAVVASVATPVLPPPTITPAPKRPTKVPTSSPVKNAGNVVKPSPVPPKKVKSPQTKKAGAGATKSGEFWVQVLASRHQESIEKIRKKLVDAGFPYDHQRVIRKRAAGGGILLKLRVGPFPDHSSASRVKERLRKKKFDDAWVIAP